MKTGLGSSGTPTRSSPMSKLSYLPLTLPTAIFIHSSLVGGIVDCVRTPHAARRARRSLQRRGAAINGELGFIVEDDEHLLHLL